MRHVIYPKKKGKEKGKKTVRVHMTLEVFLLGFEVNESQLPRAISSCFILAVTAYKIHRSLETYDNVEP